MDNFRIPDGAFATQASVSGGDWPGVSRVPTLAEGEVHVWACDLDLLFAAGFAEEVCSGDERARADKFRFSIHRERFIAGRSFMRRVLAGYSRRSPDELSFRSGPAGKPCLISGARDPRLQFNLSHSENLALLAVCRGMPVGIDCERLHSIPDAPELVRQYFSPRESVSFSRLPWAQRDTAFLNLWTRKEALLKGTGEGISHALNRVEVTFLPGETARLLAWPEKLCSQQWRLYELLPLEDFCTALAVEGRVSRIRCMQWCQTD